MLKLFLPRIVGIARAIEWVSTGRMLSAAELQGAGFLSEVVPAEALLPRARAIAREIAENTSPAAVAVSRKLMWRMLDAEHPLQSSMLETRGFTGLMRLPDAREGASAFHEKRLPQFTTRPSTDVGFMEHWWRKP